MAPSHSFPHCNPVARWLGKLAMAAWGWRFEGEIPPDRKAVLIANPHTSNWDFFFALIAGWSMGLSFSWLGKDKLFEGPLGWLLRLLGGVSVDRSKPNGLVGQVGERFDESESLLLMVPASGTRSRREYWKSGFYWMAKEAGVPIILGYLDYPRKVAGFGPALHPSDDLRADMDRIRAFYAPIGGKFPEKVSRIRLRVEDEGEPGGGQG